MVQLTALVALSLNALLASSASLAARKDSKTHGVTCGCDLKKSTTVSMHLPTNQTALVQPTTPPRYVAIGVGYQNYTCNSATSTFASIGAVATLFDLSCIEGKSDFETIAQRSYNVWISPAEGHAKADVVGAKVGTPSILGYHYFINSPTTAGAINAKWDFTSTGSHKGDATAFVVGAKVGNIPAPAPADPKVTVDWLMLNGIPGFDALASQVFRVDTVGGQPPASCAAGAAPIQVKYVAKYFLY
ncbi:hypothetical protein MIND_01243500 [Mycena indigotica]|uniref:Malate dehydrogenase n=1 Tax=Mycena indigotica TaxID=2126181 RepID=A0A8H6VXV1_9AGAR|nr:uncharacterized protein MIND_01243500 [Mycena indigotica]KAF7292164.1 hypothetical protein MIND_01243500 [Mycena indigotica]